MSSSLVSQLQTEIRITRMPRQVERPTHGAAVREPGRVLQNWFDESGRWVRQEVRSSDDDSDPYVATVRYTIEGKSVVQADFDEGDGLKRYRYNTHGYRTSETFDADSSQPIAFTYDRDATTNVLKGVTMSCNGPDGPIARQVPLLSDGDDSIKAALMRESCVPREP